MTKSLKVAVFLVAIALAPCPVIAESCTVPSARKIVFFDVVFLGTVSSVIKQYEDGRDVAIMVVEESFVSDNLEAVKVWSGPKDQRAHFEVGDRYLIFTHGSQDEILNVYTCSRLRADGAQSLIDVLRTRVIGTTPDAIQRAEENLGRWLPLSFRLWLTKNNGLDLAGLNILPVLDDRNPRMTAGDWYREPTTGAIVWNFRERWPRELEKFEDDGQDFSHLLPFAEFPSREYYCFDYSTVTADGEVAVVLWDGSGEVEFRASSFADFVTGIRNEDIYDW